MIGKLFDSGRVVDESVRRAPKTAGSSRSRDLDNIPKMALKLKPISRHRPSSLAIESEDVPTSQRPTTSDGLSQVQERLMLVWRSNPLMRRHLTIPTQPTTNQTGSMLFVKGALEGIDQRHYFRDEVFRDIDWQFDSEGRTRHMERAEARFQLVIRDVNYGVFSLKLSHNSRTDTRAYQQHNGMTQLHWGEARHIIAREDLLGRTMYIYRDSIDDGLFVLEID